MDKKVNREFNTDAKKAVFGFMQMIPPTTEKGAAMINYIALDSLTTDQLQAICDIIDPPKQQ